MKNIKRLIGMMLVLSLFLVGCASNDDSDVNEAEAPKEATSLSSDADIQEEIEANKNVEEVMIQIDATGEEDYVNVDIVVKKDENVEEDAEEFAAKIQEEYPDHIIDMIIIHDDHLIYQNQFE